MKKLLRKIIDFFTKRSRRKEIQKRQSLYEDVTNILDDLNSEKSIKQNELIDEIKKTWPELINLHEGSKFIPKTPLTKAELFTAIQEKYFFRMQELDISINKNLEFKCK